MRFRGRLPLRLLARLLFLCSFTPAHAANINADFAARYLLQREGLRPDIDVALLQVGNQSNRIVAVETNNADAAMLTPPMTLQARKLGMTLLLDASKLNIPYSSLFFVSRKQYLAKSRSDLVNFTKAMIEGVALYKSNKEFAMKVLAKYMKVQDREVDRKSVV